MSYVKRLFLLIFEKLSKVNTMPLSILIIGLGILFGAIFWALGRPDNKLIAALEVSATFFIWGFVGVLFIKRREAPFLLGKIRGLPAILYGVFLTLIFWVTVIILILNSIL